MKAMRGGGGGEMDEDDQRSESDGRFATVPAGGTIDHFPVPDDLQANDADEGGGGGENQSDEDERGRGARVVGRESGADGLLNGGWVEARDRHRTYGE